MEENKKNTRTKYLNDYRKKRFKQISVDIPIKTAEEFNETLKKEKISKRQFFLKAILDFIDSHKK